MFNVTILRMKDIFRYIIWVIILIALICIIKIINVNKEKKEEEEISEEIVEEIIEVEENTESKIEVIEEENSTKTASNGIEFIINILIQTIPLIANIENEYSYLESTYINNENIASLGDIKDINIFNEILNSQISLIGALELNSQDENILIEDLTSNEEENKDNTEEIISNENNEELEYAKTDVETNVITINPFSDNANITYGNIKIKNETDYVLTEDILNPDIDIENENILIFHTHTCESYTPTDLYNYVASGTYRTTDLNYSVAAVGEELTKYLMSYGYNILHNQEYHDYPAYTGSYTRSLVTVEKTLETFDADIIIDIHRDAVGSTLDYAPCVQIGDDVAAQLMFVIGTDAGGLTHEQWQQNLKFAVLVQQKAEEMYPRII